MSGGGVGLGEPVAGCRASVGLDDVPGNGLAGDHVGQQHALPVVELVDGQRLHLGDVDVVLLDVEGVADAHLLQAVLPQL